MKRLAVLAIAACATLASAGTVYRNNQSGEMVPWESAQRALTFGERYHWSTTEGEILVCPYGNETSYDKDCYAKNDKTKKKQWIPITSYSIPGFELAGFRYVQSGSQRELEVYWRAAKPTKMSNEALDALGLSKQPVKPGIIQTDSLTITTDKVIVQRKK